MIEMPPKEFSNDENGDVLRKMQERGGDLSIPRDVDFYFTFESEAEAENFAEQEFNNRNVGLGVTLRRTPIVANFRHEGMVPTHNDITATENLLGQIAELYNANRMDGVASNTIDYIRRLQLIHIVNRVAIWSEIAPRAITKKWIRLCFAFSCLWRNCKKQSLFPIARFQWRVSPLN